MWRGHPRSREGASVAGERERGPRPIFAERGSAEGPSGGVRFAQRVLCPLLALGDYGGLKLLSAEHPKARVRQAVEEASRERSAQQATARPAEKAEGALEGDVRAYGEKKRCVLERSLDGDAAKTKTSMALGLSCR